MHRYNLCFSCESQKCVTWLCSPASRSIWGSRDRADPSAVQPVCETLGTALEKPHRPSAQRYPLTASSKKQGCSRTPEEAGACGSIALSISRRGQRRR